MVNKVHMLKPLEGYDGKTVERVTYCGLRGWREMRTEYSTVNGDRFEVTTNYKEVTCKRCRGT